MNAREILERHYLEIRSRLLDVGAALDRIERGDEPEAALNDDRWEQLQSALRILSDESGNRAEQLQMLFSDEYVAGWNEASAR